MSEVNRYGTDVDLVRRKCCVPLSGSGLNDDWTPAQALSAGAEPVDNEPEHKPSANNARLAPTR